MTDKEEFAAATRELYEAFILKGFNADQALQITIAVLPTVMGQNTDTYRGVPY